MMMFQPRRWQYTGGNGERETATEVQKAGKKCELKIAFGGLDRAMKGMEKNEWRKCCTLQLECTLFTRRKGIAERTHNSGMYENNHHTEILTTHQNPVKLPRREEWSKWNLANNIWYNDIMSSIMTMCNSCMMPVPPRPANLMLVIFWNDATSTRRNRTESARNDRNRSTFYHLWQTIVRLRDRRGSVVAVKQCSLKLLTNRWAFVDTSHATQTM